MKFAVIYLLVALLLCASDAAAGTAAGAAGAAAGGAGADAAGGAGADAGAAAGGTAGTASKDGMVCIPGGEFWMGCEEVSFRDTRPLHQVSVKSFWLDKAPVTNEDFARFVADTGYKTIAELTPSAADFPGAPPENLVPGSLVFTPPTKEVSRRSHYSWWRYVPGACWRHPEGPQSDLKGKEKHPVVHVAWPDAVAYAKWAGKRLPTEAEFEFAARGKLDRKRFAWGDEFKPVADKWQANIWQGRFPYINTAEDGYATTSPVESYPANGYGLYDMAGNVWQWCQDWYHADYYKTLSVARVCDNPKGPDKSFDPNEPGIEKRVQRGGSFLCTDQYCARYLVGARGRGEPSSASSNVGFRCASD